ncbi:hypothetical protein E4U31_004582 [Claviceps sp. LM219 group G6]|nr:hypothetical protein E4U31_004582 [Claviceps sp. LM219 group G6]
MTPGPWALESPALNPIRFRRGPSSTYYWNTLFARWWHTLVTLLGRSWKTLFSPAWKLLTFPSEGFALISADEKIEEETLPGYVASQFYPAKIGEILRARYQIVGKLGYGVTSTVLASTESKVSQAFSKD